jgi:putative oxidoreductase
MLKKLISTQNDIIATIARLTLGLVIFPHGAQKALGLFGGYGFSATLDFFTRTGGLPYIIALLVIAAEFLGALGLIVGLLSRVAAFGIACVMVGAIVTTHFANGFFMNWSGGQTGEGFEYHLLALGLAIIIMIRGSGKFSIDKKLENKCCK